MRVLLQTSCSNWQLARIGASSLLVTSRRMLTWSVLTVALRRGPILLPAIFEVRTWPEFAALRDIIFFWKYFLCNGLSLELAGAQGMSHGMRPRKIIRCLCFLVNPQVHSNSFPADFNGMTPRKAIRFLWFAREPPGSVAPRGKTQVFLPPSDPLRH